MSGDSMMELERPGEEKKNRWEVNTAAKSGGGGGDGWSEEEKKKSSVESWLKREVVVVVEVEGSPEGDCLSLKKQRRKCLDNILDIFFRQTPLALTEIQIDV